MIPKKLVLELAKGFRGRSKNCIRIARERVEKALQYAYRSVNRIDSCVAYSPAYCMFCNFNISIINDHPRDRRVRRRDLRSQWIQQINAGTIVTPCSRLNIIDQFKFIDHKVILILCAGSREHGLKYQQLVHGLNIAGRILCDMHCIHSHLKELFPSLLLLRLAWHLPH